MKKFILGLAVLTSFSSFAATISSTKSNTVNVARIDKVITLVEKADIKVNVVVQDLGGSTDVSPTKNIFFTLYSKGEMFSTDATFDLGPAYEVLSAKRIAGGVYEIKATLSSKGDSMMKTVTLKVDAAKAINKIKAVDCGDEFDCDASTAFSADINVSNK
jgi:hypothetical protein